MMHGCFGNVDWEQPTLVTSFDVNARLTFTGIKAHEYLDHDDVLRMKVQILARLIRESNNFIAYTGAGISTAAGIDDYATRAKDKSLTSANRPVIRDWKQATPTKAHYIMTAMYYAGYLKHWVQQNHDSLPQKAGFPQHALNEIHGSLHDPSNPIVPYEGCLRHDLYNWMQEWQEKSDLCLAMGTSLSGFNADSVPGSVASRFFSSRTRDIGGLVIINLQETPYDSQCSLRIFAKIDTVMELLSTELSITHLVHPMGYNHSPPLPEGCQLEPDVFRLPFSTSGLSLLTRRNAASRKDFFSRFFCGLNSPSVQSTGGIILDLRLGHRVQLTGGPYEGDVGVVVGKTVDGHYRIRFTDSVNPTFNILRRPFTLILGSWWIHEASHGYTICTGSKLPVLPYLNDSIPKEPVKAAPSPAERADSYQIYAALSRKGLPEGAVRHKMVVDGISDDVVTTFFDRMRQEQINCA
jgi:NAD-dependent SIR2 family protein deacetylase